MAKKAATDRNVRISEQIKKDVSILIQREMRDPRIGLVTIQEVRLTADYTHAKCFFTTLGADAKVTEKVLNESSGFLRNQLFKMLRIHTVPSLHFVFDSTLENAIELSGLIDIALASRSVEDDVADTAAKDTK